MSAAERGGAWTEARSDEGRRHDQRAAERPGEVVSAAAGFPGAVGISHLRVYDWPGADGLAGGSPHLHTASTEGYVVLHGTGALQTLSGDGYRETPLKPGTLLWFTPGTIHRLVNTSGDLTIIVVMQNAGLPEAGDAVLTFPPSVLADPARYAAAVRIPAAAGAAAAPADATGAAAAQRRRDLALEGFTALRAEVAEHGPAALRPLYEAAARLVHDKSLGWQHIWRDRTLAQAQQTGHHLAALAAGVPDHLNDARLFVARNGGGERLGMCGRLSLSAWDLDGVHDDPPINDR